MINNSRPFRDPTIGTVINAGSIGSHGAIPHAMPILSSPVSIPGLNNTNFSSGPQIAVHPVGTPVLYTPVSVGRVGSIVPSAPVSQPIKRVPVPISHHITAY